MNRKYLLPLLCAAAIAVHILTPYKLDQYVVMLVVIGLIPWLPTWLESVRVGDFEAKFRKMEEELQATRAEVEQLKKRYTELEDDYLAECEKFDPEASAAALNRLASSLKGKAKGLASVDFLFNNLSISSPQPVAFGAACAMQVRPAFHTLDAIVSLLSGLAQKPDLGGYRLKTIYRLLMAVDEVVRLNSKNEGIELVSAEQAEKIRRMAVLISQNARCRNDDTAGFALKIAEKL